MVERQSWLAALQDRGSRDKLLLADPSSRSEIVLGLRSPNVLVFVPLSVSWTTWAPYVYGIPVPAILTFFCSRDCADPKSYAQPIWQHSYESLVPPLILREKKMFRHPSDAVRNTEGSVHASSPLPSGKGFPHSSSLDLQSSASSRRRVSRTSCWIKTSASLLPRFIALMWTAPPVV
jgi:hypothetical protein